MKTPLICGALASVAILSASSSLAAAAAAAKPEVAPADKRQAAIQLANKLLKPAELAPLAPDLKSPFNPPGFDDADPDEPRPAVTSGATAAPGGKPGTPGKPASARDVLNLAAPQIPKAGVIGDPRDPTGKQLLLSIGQKTFRVGDPLTVKIDDVPYTMEISAISFTSYTLRYQGEETTRSINTGTKK